LELCSKRRQKNNSNRVEICLKSSRIQLDRLKKTEISKELNITPVLEAIQEYRRNCLQHVNRMPRNRLGRILKTTSQQAEGTRGDHQRHLTTCEAKLIPHK